MEDILVPLAFFGVVPFIVWSVTHYRHKSRAKLAETVQSIAASGQPVDPELIKNLGMPGKRAHSDLRGGLIAIAVGLGFAVMGQAIPDPEAGPMMLSLGSFPIFIGLALIGFWFFVSRKTDA